MDIKDNYHRGLLFLSFALIGSEREIGDNELYHIHKMRIEEGISDEVFSYHLLSLLGKSGTEIYQIGIDAINECSEEFKFKAIARLLHMTREEKILNEQDIKTAFCDMGLTVPEIHAAFRSRQKHPAAA